MVIARDDAYGYAAQQISEKIVLAHLKYPLDATFGWNNPGRKNEKGYWVCEGTVKAMNGFGANITNTYSVVLLIDKKADSVKCVSVVFNGKILALDIDSINTKNADSSEDTKYKIKMEQAIANDKKSSASPPPTKPPENPFKRNWISSNGKHETQAELVSYKDSVVVLRRIDDGKEITMEESKLSIDDRNFLRKQRGFKKLDEEGRPIE